MAVKSEHSSKEHPRTNFAAILGLLVVLEREKK